MIRDKIVLPFHHVGPGQQSVANFVAFTHLKLAGIPVLLCTSCHHWLPDAGDGNFCGIRLSLASVLFRRCAHRCPRGRWW